MKQLKLVCFALLLGCAGFGVEAATLSATKTVAGVFAHGTTVTYTVVITNTSATTQADNPGDEFTDNNLPFQLFNVNATATSGTPATFGNTVTWNGSLAAGASVTVTITATIVPYVGAGQSISNQGTVSFDADDNNTNESSASTDDPNVGGAGDPTVFVSVANGPGFAAPSNRPAATLLLPYFEVDPIGNFPSVGGGALNTLVTLTNVNFTGILTKVTVWTDYGIPTLAFNLYFTGYDTETLDLRELFDGVLPRSATAGQDPSDTISNQGSLSQDINYVSCSSLSTLNFTRLQSADIIGLRNAHSGLASSLLGNQCGSRNHGDGILRGYITIDAVNSCDDTLFPNDAGYESFLSAQNYLTGNWSIVDGANNFAESGSLVHVMANNSPLPPGTVTFYRQFNGDTRLKALGNTWGSRYLTGGASSEQTDLTVWREPRSKPAPVACGNFAPAFLPGNQAQIVAFDEEENPVELVPGIDPNTVQADPFALVTQSVRVGAPYLGLPFNNGWLNLNLNHDSGTLLAQSFVSSRRRSEGRFSVGVDAVMLGHPANQENFALSTENGPFFPEGLRVSATKIVSGSFVENGAITYTVIITNQGPQTQLDNPTDEFVDNLPGPLTLVSATASGGTATTSGNLVTWNGSLAANASVTITINATINAGAAGITVSNFGTVFSDVNLDGVNETQTRTDDPGTPALNDTTRFTVAP